MAPNQGMDKEIKFYLRSIAIILIGYGFGFVSMALTDHFKLDKLDGIIHVMKPEHDEMWYSHKYKNNTDSSVKGSSVTKN